MMRPVDVPIPKTYEWFTPLLMGFWVVLILAIIILIFNFWPESCAAEFILDGFDSKEEIDALCDRY